MYYAIIIYRVSIQENLRLIQNRIELAARSVRKSLQDITLVAVVKNIPTDQISQAIEAGVTSIGENRVQEALARDKILREKFPRLVIHMIGHLQTNKVRQALDSFDIIQSVDSVRLAAEIDRRALKPVPILIEINASGEAAKYGIEPDKAAELVRSVSKLENIKVRGLMTIGPLTDDRAKLRSAFRKLRELRDELAREALEGVEMKFLSMGMTGDFDIAIEEGANLIRIGRGIFKEA